ncbi:MAG: hypothetical protein ACYCPK_04835 [Acidimicrobiales bacterium]
MPANPLENPGRRTPERAGQTLIPLSFERPGTGAGERGLTERPT